MRQIKDRRLNRTLITIIVNDAADLGISKGTAMYKKVEKEK